MNDFSCVTDKQILNQIIIGLDNLKILNFTDISDPINGYKTCNNFNIFNFLFKN